MTEYHPLPQPDDIPVREKEDAMGAYFMMFASVAIGLPLPIVNLIAAIVYYYLNKDKSRYVNFHALQSLLSQLPTTVINWGVFYILIRYFFWEDEFTRIHMAYIGMAVVANLLYFIFSIVAAVKARKGRFYYFVFFGSFCYNQVYKIREERPQGKAENLPPKI